jgi:hypothetical protein
VSIVSFVTRFCEKIGFLNISIKFASINLNLSCFSHSIFLTLHLVAKMAYLLTLISVALFIPLVWAVEPAGLTAFVRQIPVVLTPDSLHFVMQLTVSPFADPSVTQSGRAAQTLNIIADTGSSELTLFDNAFCSRSHRVSTTACVGTLAMAQSSTIRRQFVNNIDLDTIYDPLQGTFVYQGYLSINTGDGAPLLTTCMYNTQGQPVFDSPTTLPGAAGASCPTAEVMISHSMRMTLSSFPLQFFRFEDGFLGMAFNALAHTASPWLQLLNAMDSDSKQFVPLLTLDFRPSGQPSRILVGGIDLSYRNSMQWGDANVVPNFHGFRVYRMRLCGVDLFSNFTSALPLTAVIDTGSSGLLLPAEIFDAIIAWIPATCSRVGIQKVCTVPASVASSPLPDLAFSISRDPSAADLYLSLNNLLLPAAYTGNPTADTSYGVQRVMLLRGQQLIGNTAPAMMVFGANAIKDFQVALSMSTAQVGLAQREPRAASSYQCLAPATCIGQQDAYPYMRLCVDPDCDRFEYYVLDPVTRECQLNVGLRSSLIAIAFLFAIGEIFLHRRHLKVEEVCQCF